MRLLLALFLTALALSVVEAADDRDKARELLINGDAAGAAALYSPLARGSKDAGLVSEYAFALAASGLTDLSLAQMDRAGQLDPRAPEVLAFGSAVLTAAGLKDAGADLAQPLPAWAAKLTAPEAARGPIGGEFKPAILAADRFLQQRRYYGAAERLSRITAKYPKEPLGWSAYGIALEELGAFKAAAKAVERERALTPDTDESGTLLLEAQQKILAAKPKVEPMEAPKPNEMLKGRYLAFLGASVTHAQSNTITNFSGRAGKFLTNQFDVAADLGYTSGNASSKYDGASFGFSARYHQPIAGSLPVNFVMGGRIQYLPAPSDNTAVILSPGLSYFLESGSIDLFLDIAVSGPMKNTRTLSLGYTAYFGGGS